MPFIDLQGVMRPIVLIICPWRGPDLAAVCMRFPQGSDELLVPGCRNVAGKAKQNCLAKAKKKFFQPWPGNSAEPCR